jgi:hypothetical protein
MMVNPFKTILYFSHNGQNRNDVVGLKFFHKPQQPCFSAHGGGKSRVTSTSLTDPPFLFDLLLNSGLRIPFQTRPRSKAQGPCCKAFHQKNLSAISLPDFSGHSGKPQ